MAKFPVWFTLILLAALSLSCDNNRKDQAAPRISSQGFSLQEVQQGVVRHFPPLRIRFESAGRIKQLRIQERSYDVDLATTREPRHFDLFGLEKRVLLHKDITLDFSPYINHKLDQPGEYQFEIMITDKLGKHSQAVLKIRLLANKDKTTPIETGQFQLQRIGMGEVVNSETFGIHWLTVDEIMVTIRVSKSSGGANKLAQFTARDYNALRSKEQLQKQMTRAQDLDMIEFATSNNAAVDQVLGVSTPGGHYLLRVTQSSTSLSYPGTTVNISGQYKY